MKKNQNRVRQNASAKAAAQQVPTPKGKSTSTAPELPASIRVGADTSAIDDLGKDPAMDQLREDPKNPGQFYIRRKNGKRYPITREEAAQRFLMMRVPQTLWPLITRQEPVAPKPAPAIPENPPVAEYGKRLAGFTGWQAAFMEDGCLHDFCELSVEQIDAIGTHIGQGKANANWSAWLRAAITEKLQRCESELPPAIQLEHTVNEVVALNELTSNFIWHTSEGIGTESLMTKKEAGQFNAGLLVLARGVMNRLRAANDAIRRTQPN